MKNLCLLLVALSLASCSNYYYAPNAHNVPLFKEKNEARLDIKGSTGDDFGAFEAQGAYSVAENLGVTANFISASGGSPSNTRRGRGVLGEVGIGYYNEVVPNLVFETYGGIGLGKITNHYSSGPNGAASVYNVIRPYVQPSIGYASDIFDAAFSTRVCLLSYASGRFENVNSFMPDDAYQVMYIDANRNCLMVEPAITLRVGWKYVKFQVQATYSANLSNSIPMRPFTLSGGIYMSLAPRFGF